MYLRDTFKAHFKDSADIKFIDPSYLIRWVPGASAPPWLRASRLEGGRARLRLHTATLVPRSRATPIDPAPGALPNATSASRPPPPPAALSLPRPTTASTAR
jgi:hypothetical protein